MDQFKIKRAFNFIKIGNIVTIIFLTIQYLILIILAYVNQVSPKSTIIVIGASMVAAAVLLVPNYFVYSQLQKNFSFLYIGIGIFISCLIFLGMSKSGGLLLLIGYISMLHLKHKGTIATTNELEN